MASDVTICNLALSNIGKDTINALTDAGAEARACSQFYTITLEMLLQSYPWRFAGRVVSLAEIANDRAGQWAHAYQRPSDCMKIRGVRAEYSEETGAVARQDEITTPFEVEGSTIYCDLSPAVLRYTSNNLDQALFPPMFVDALSWHLAVRLAMPLTRDPKIRADAWQVAQQMTAAAQMADANEQRETSDIMSELVTVRFDG